MSVIGSIDAVIDSFSLEAYNGLSIRKQVVRNILRRLNNAAAIVSKIDDQLSIPFDARSSTALLNCSELTSSKEESEM